MRKWMFLIWLLLYSIGLQASTSILKPSENVVFWLHEPLDSDGIQCKPDSIHIRCWRSDLDSACYHVTNTTYPFSSIGVDTTKSENDTSYVFRDQVQDIDGTSSAGTMLSIEIAFFTDDLPTRTFHTVQIVDTTYNNMANTASREVPTVDVTHYEGDTDVDANIQSECADALTAYDPPTDAEMEARTLLSDAYFHSQSDYVMVNYVGTGVLDAADFDDDYWVALADSNTSALDIYDPPTNAEMEARTLVTGDYFLYGSDAVANVTLTATTTNLTTNNDKTGYSLSAFGLDSDTSFTALQAELTKIYGVADSVRDTIVAHAPHNDDWGGTGGGSCPTIGSIYDTCAAAIHDSAATIAAMAESTQVALHDTVWIKRDDYKADVTNLDATVSSRAAETSVTAVRDSMDEASQVADVSSVALEASVTAVRDSMDEASQVVDISDVALEVSVTAVRDSMDEASRVASGFSTHAALDIWNILFSTGFTAGSMGDSLNNASYVEGDVSACAGTGIHEVTIYAVDTSASPDAVISYATMNVKNYDQSSTLVKTQLGSAGFKAVNLDADSFQVLITATSYTFDGATQINVTGTQTDTVFASQFTPGAPDDPDLCRVYGYAKDSGGNDLVGARVTLLLASVTSTLYYDGVEYVAREHYTFTDSDGYWYLDVIANSKLDADSEYWYTIMKQNHYLTPKDKTITVPDQENVDIDDLL